MSKVLAPRLPAGVEVVCLTGPPTAPASISDPSTSIASTNACLEGFKHCRDCSVDPGHGVNHVPHVFDMRTYDAVLVACFSAHPLPACESFLALSHTYHRHN